MQTYFQGKNYFELDVDVGSSKIAYSLYKLFHSGLDSMVCDIGFLIETHEVDEQSERVLGTVRIRHGKLKESIVPATWL